MACINAVRSSLWASRGRKLLGDITYIDVDGTNVPTYGKRKRGMDISYQGIWGYHPLVISLSNTKEVLFLVNRPGNVPSHTGAAQWIDAAIDLVQPHAKRICVRGDTDFFLTRHLDRWAKSVDFIFGMDANAAMRSRAEALDEAQWQPLQRKPRYHTVTDQKRKRNQPHEKQRIVHKRGLRQPGAEHEHVAEFNYQPTRCKRGYRVVVLRKNISKMKGDLVLFDECRYFFYITTRTDVTPKRSSPAPTNAAIRRTSSSNSKTASTPCACPCMTWSATGLYGHRRPGLEPQILVCHDDAQTP